jgi:hypothetical protein
MDKRILFINSFLTYKSLQEDLRLYLDNNNYDNKILDEKLELIREVFELLIYDLDCFLQELNHC